MGYIEDITRRCEDMNFIFEWLKQYFTNERSEWVKYCFYHEKIKFISSIRRVMFCLLYSCKQFKTQVSNINFRSIILKAWLYFNIIETKTIPVHHFSVFLYYFHFFRHKHVVFFFKQRWKLVRCSYKHRYFENTKLLAGNDHVIDIFTSEDMENILQCIFSMLLSTI